MAIQTVNLADNINAAILKINQNFDEIETGVYTVIDSADITNLVTNILDSDYFLTVINEEYFNSLNINVTTDLTSVDSDLAAHASSLLSLTSSITTIDGTITVLAQAQIATQSSLDNMVLDGIDSDLLASAIANANTTLTSQIVANADGIAVYASAIDSVNASLILLDSATNDRIDLATSATSTLSSLVTANASGLTAVVADVTQLEIDLNQVITDGIVLTPEQISTALGGATEALTLRMDADSDSLVLEAAKIVDLDVEFTAFESDTGDLITARAAATAALTSRVEYTEAGIVSTSADIVTLNQQIDITNAAGVLSTAIAAAETDLRAEITVVDGRITSTNTSLTDTLNAKIFDDIATAKTLLQANIDAVGNTTASWQLDLVAGTEANPHIAGIKFGNDGALAEFAITADTFKIINASNSEIQPFTVDGNNIVLSNATVTGGLNIGSGLTGAHTEMQDDVIKVFDAGGQLRVHLGNLTA